MEQQPSVGRIVHYKLTMDDANAINKRRSEFVGGRTLNEPWNKGAQAHVGNFSQMGDDVPAIIIRVWPNEYGDKPGINAQVFLDGNDSLWITSKEEGDKNGQWHWPERV